MNNLSRLHYFVTGILLFGFVACGQQSTKSNNERDSIDSNSTKTTDKEEIQNLIRQTLKWAESSRFDLLPALIDSIDSVCIGFDLNKFKANLDILRATDFFANEFIENYKHIILTLDKKLRNHEFEWSGYELPPFRFASDVDPWCLCQATPYDNPIEWNYIQIEIIRINNDSAQLVWKWGEIPNAPYSLSEDWKNSSYNFKVVKENGKWKISYLQGFDFKESTENDE